MARFDSDARRNGLSRRQFLGALSVPLLAAGCGRRPPYDPSQFHRLALSPVGLFPAVDYAVDFADVIGRGLRELGVDVRGRSVFLKPNIVEYESHTAINTHPLVIAGAAVAFRAAGARDVVVGEGPGHRRDMEYLLTKTGLYDQLREHRVRFVDLNHDDVRSVRLSSHFTGLDAIQLPVELLQADFIVSMPKLKTHHWAAMTAGMKNFFGAVPSAVYGWPKNFLHVHGIENSILDLNATIRPHFSIVDAVTAMEGDGPIMGRPRNVGFIGMGPDVVAMDATCARIIGLDPTKMPHLHEAGRFLGNIEPKRIEHRGEPPSKYETTFDIVEHFKIIRLRPERPGRATRDPLAGPVAPAGY